YDGGGNEIAKSEKKLNLRYAHQPTPAVTKQLLILAIEASIALFHRHAGERESGRNVRRRQLACLNFNQGDLVRDWSKPREAGRVRFPGGVICFFIFLLLVLLVAI